MGVNDPTTPPDPSSQTFSRAYVEELRAESARYRTKNKELEGRLAEGPGALEAENRSLKIRMALNDKASELNINPKLAHALLTTNGSLTTVDPGADDFGETMTELLSTLAEREPAVKTSRLPARGGADTGPGPGGLPSNQLSLAEIKGMRPDEIAAAYASGRLNQAMGRRG